MNYQRIVLTCSFALGLALHANAQDIGSLKEMGISDGGITKQKADAVLSARFDAMDNNHDGKLSKEEYVNAGVSRIFALDSDGDGKVTKTELRAALRDHFRR